ncbi:MAG TPA: Sec-independent protein translocase subunit TatA [Actinocrinis sp.]|jgi:sec-independent protein translocase protein TatA
MLIKGLEGWHIIIILALVVVLFGSRKMPDAARSIGQSLRIFKSEMKAAASDGQNQGQQNTAAAVPPAVEGRVVNPQGAANVADSVPQPHQTPQA